MTDTRDRLSTKTRDERQRRRLVVLILATLIAIFVAASISLFVVPGESTLKPAQAVVVLGGSGPRLQLGENIVRQGFARVLVVSTSSTGWTCPDDIEHVRIVCFNPVPSTTQGEARFVRRLVAKDRWSRIIVVAGTPQVTRARIRFSRCMPHTTLLMESVPPGGVASWLSNIVYEWGAMVKAEIWQRGC